MRWHVGKLPGENGRVKMSQGLHWQCRLFPRWASVAVDYEIWLNPFVEVCGLRGKWQFVDAVVCCYRCKIWSFIYDASSCGSLWTGSPYLPFIWCEGSCCISPHLAHTPVPPGCMKRNMQTQSNRFCSTLCFASLSANAGCRRLMSFRLWGVPWFSQSTGGRGRNSAHRFAAKAEKSVSK